MAGYSEPTITIDILSDGSEVYGVLISGDYDIQINCKDVHAAENLLDVWDHSVVSVDII